MCLSGAGTLKVSLVVVFSAGMHRRHLYSNGGTRIRSSSTGFGIEKARLRLLARLRFADAKASADTLRPGFRIPPSVERVRSEIPDGDKCGVWDCECGDEDYVDPQELLRFAQAGDEGQDEQ